MSTRGNLIAARKLIENESDWCQGGFTNDAGARCALQAIYDAKGVHWCDGVRAPEYKALKEAMGGQFPGDFNDAHTHAEVLAAFDRAIAASAS